MSISDSPVPWDKEYNELDDLRMQVSVLQQIETRQRLEIQSLKLRFIEEEKDKAYTEAMETIDRQRNLMARAAKALKDMRPDPLPDIGITSILSEWWRETDELIRKLG